MNNIHKVNTIEDIITYGKNLEYSHSKLHVKAKIETTKTNDLVLNYNSLLLKYYDLCKEFIVEVELSNLEFVKYKYQPKLLSLDLYGTTELWSSILNINHMASVLDFTNQKIKLFRDDIFDFINEILILEDMEIKRNNSEIE